jgi:hypothetical protein
LAFKVQRNSPCGLTLLTLGEDSHAVSDFSPFLEIMMEPNQILKILSSITPHNYTQDDFYGKDDDEMEELNVSMKRLILAYVQNNCECIL